MTSPFWDSRHDSAGKSWNRRSSQSGTKSQRQYANIVCRNLIGSLAGSIP
jgi:hypothetical protein